MVWIIIGVLVLAAIGPIFYLMPSKRERQLANVRMIARRLGLGVDLTHIPDVAAPPEARVSAGGVERHPTIECASYKRLHVTRLEHAPTWQLLRDESSRAPLSGWRFADRNARIAQPAAYWTRIAPIIDALPGGCLSVHCTAQFTAWAGTETFKGEDPETVITAISDGLGEIIALHTEMDAAIRAEKGEETDEP